jgi:hypothetical protein
MMLVDDRTGGSRWTQFMLENITFFSFLVWDSENM